MNDWVLAFIAAVGVVGVVTWMIYTLLPILVAFG